MNEAIEKAEFMKKPIALAKSSRQYIERLWKIGIDVSKFGASIASFFSSIFNTLVKTVTRVVSFSRGVRELSLTRFMFLPPFDLWLRRVTPPKEEYFPTEMGRANVSFLFNVTVARKTAAELARRVAAKTPKPVLLPRPVPLPEAELIEETVEERVEEPAKTVPQIVTDLQSRFESKLAPSIKGVALALQEYGRQTILLAPLLAMPKPLLVGPARLEGLPPHPLAAPPEKKAPQVGLPERPLAVIPQVPSPPRKEAKVKPPPPVAREPTTLPPMRPSQIGRALEEISPSLTSWIYGVSETLRGTALSLSAVPVAASTAQKVVTETLIQPVPSFETPGTSGIQEPVLGMEGVKPGETGVGRAEVEAFRLPTIVASLIVALSQRYPLLFSEPVISETWETPFEPTRVAPEETTAPGRMPEVKSFSKLPTVIALAAAESLIAQRLQYEFSALIGEMQVARSSYVERLGELGAYGPTRTTMLGKLAAAAPALSPALEPYAPGIPSAPSPSARLGPVSPPIQNTFNITISAESTEEDLRDLERKIDRILSEQMRRYYGSTRI